MGFRDDQRLQKASSAPWTQVGMVLALHVLSLVLLGTLSPTALGAESEKEVHRIQVDSYRRDFDVSAQMAERNLATQEDGAGIVRQLEVLQGDEYAGIWFDNESGEFVVPLLPTAKRGATEASLVHAHLDGDFRVAPARYSWEELEAIQEGVDESLRPAIEAGLVQTSLDPRTNAVVLHEAKGVSSAGRATIRRAAATAPGAVEVRSEPISLFNATTGACNTYYIYNEAGEAIPGRVCDPPLRAGVLIGPSICTAGFKAIGNVNGNRFMLTAGHCAGVGTNFWSKDGGGTNRDIGVVEQQNFIPGDWAKIRVKSTSWWEEHTSYWPSQVVYWYSGGIQENIGVTYESSSYMGQSVCHSGTRTGTSCGIVTALGKTADYYAQNLTEASGSGMCGWPGDSGGPVFSGTTALGIYSGQYGIPPCGGNAILYAEITEATADLGVTVGTPAGAQPYAETAAASSVQAHQATGNGKVDPNGLPTEFKFAYGPTTEYGSWSPSGSAGSGWSAGAVNAPMYNLTPNTAYHYRVVATNTAGYYLGGDKVFTTPMAPPSVSTVSAQSITDTEATLAANVNPENSGTTAYYAEYGPTTAYGSKTPEGSLPNGAAAVGITRVVSSLKADTTYHFRIVAKNAAGTTYGSDQAFRTLEQPPSFLYSIGSEGSGNGQFKAPFAIAVDSQNNIWVADTANHRIQKFNSKGEFLLKFGSLGSGNGQFESPMGLAVDAQDNIWVVDSGNDRVQKFSPTGEYLSKFGSFGSGNGQFDSPIGITTNTSGQLFVTDAGNSRVQKFTSKGEFLLKFGSAGNGLGQFEVPWDIASDSSGNVWVADYYHYRVQRFNSNGEFLGTFGSQGTGYGQFNLPTGLATDSKGHLWVADTFNYRIQGFNTGGEMRVLFGKFGSGGGQLNIPRDIVVDGLGNIWVVDQNNNRIQKWVYPASPKVTTQPATEVKPTSVVLNALINPQGLPTTYQFEYGKTTAYGSKVPLAPQSVGSDTVNTSVSQALGGIEPETTYHVRAVATNAKGKTLGEDLTFTTPAVPLIFSYFFGAEGGGGGQLNHPYGLAFDPSGFLWVADTDNNRIQKFTPKGELVAQAGGYGTANGQLDRPRDVAVDPEGNVWVADTGNSRIQKFNSKGEFLLKFGSAGSGNGQLLTPRGLGIDSGGNIWVADTNNSRIQKFNSKGEFLLKYGASYQFLYPADVAFDSKGTAFVLGNGGVQKLGPNGETVSQFGYPYLDYPSGIAIDSSDNVWVSDSFDGVLHKFSPEGKFLIQAGEAGGGNGQLQNPFGIAIDSKGHVWVADTLNNRITEWIYGGRPQGKAKVTTEPAIEVLGNSASLNASINPEGLATEYQIEYGKTTAYGGKVPSIPKPIGAGTSAVAVTQTATGLTGETTYHYRVVAESEAGVNYGADMTFTTLQTPKIVSQSATEVKAAGATLNATINPQGFPTTYQIEYGKTTAYGTKVPAAPKSVGSGTTNVLVSEPTGGLEPQVTYHYRTVATSSAGTSYGSDLTFTTIAPPPSFGFAFGSSGAGAGQFKEPSDLAIDGEGGIWVVEVGNNRIQKFNSKGEFVFQFGSTGSANGQFLAPRGLALDPEGNVWIADTNNNRVQKFNSKGEFLLKFGSVGSGNGQFSAPRGLAVDPAGNVWVADTGNGRIQKFNSKGEFLLKFGSPGSGIGQFVSPQAIDVDAQGNIWVVEVLNRVQKFNPEGQFLLAFGSAGNGNGQFLLPRGLVVDPKGNAWVADTGNNRVQKFNSTGEVQTVFGGKGSGAGQFMAPVGIALDSAGNIWIVDQENNRVQKWSY